MKVMELQFHFAKVEKDIDEFLDGVEYEHRYVKKLIMERQKSRFRKGLGVRKRIRRGA